jgi:hypothetical protein
MQFDYWSLMLFTVDIVYGHCIAETMLFSLFFFLETCIVEQRETNQLFSWLRCHVSERI